MLTTSTGVRATIPMKMMSEIPLPIPRSVIISPSHMMKIVPAVIVRMVKSRKPNPGFGTIATSELRRSRKIEIPAAWTIDSSTVP